LKDNIRHPCFITGISSYVLLLISVVLKINAYSVSTYLFFISIGVGGIHWLWSTYVVLHNKQLNGQSRILWTITVLLIPPFGGLFYFLMKHKNVRI
jgi:hypothetical protein